MLKAISHVNVWVHDQDEAKTFYIEKLGFEEREDVTLEEFGNYRWLTVGPSSQPEVNVMLSIPAPPAIDEENAKTLLGLIASGGSGPGIIRTDDCRKECERLKSEGVEITAEPEERFYGMDAGFRDPSGNEWRIVEPKDYDIADLK